MNTLSEVQATIARHQGLGHAHNCSIRLRILWDFHPRAENPLNRTFSSAVRTRRREGHFQASAMARMPDVLGQRVHRRDTRVASKM